MASLPKSFDLSQPIPSLPDGATSQLITCRPISGSSFGANSIIEVDLGNRGWCDPQSLSIRYKVNVTSIDASGNVVIGCPIYSPFVRLNTLVGGSNIDSISQWNQTCAVLVAGNYDVSAKYGLQSQLGFGSFTAGVTTIATTGNMAYMDGRQDIVNGAYNYTLSGPLLGSMLASCEKQLPLFAMPQIRFQFTIDSLANIFLVETARTFAKLPSAYQITNFELCYTMTDMGAGVEKMVYEMGRSLTLKSHGISNSAVPIANGSNGSTSFVFNQRFASIRSAFICPNALTGSKWCEFVDATNNLGDYQILVGNQAFPQAPLSAVNNKAGILQETRRAFGNLYDTGNTMSIDFTEFSQILNVDNILYYESGKFIVGVNLDKIQSTDHALMAGTSTYNTPISVNINFGGAVTSAGNLNLVLDYDAILVLDPVARQLSVRS